MTLGNLTANLSRIEFACPCVRCEEETPVVDIELATAIQAAADHFSNVKGHKVVVIITSGNRCKEYNAKVGGAEHSKHTKALAADVRIPVITPKELYDFFDEYAPDKWGLGLYERHVHIDVRNEKARWKNVR